MSHVLIGKLIESLGNALAEAVVTPEFVKTLDDADLYVLHDLIRSEAFDRNIKLNESNLLSSAVSTLTPEAQLAALREQYGDNGQKQLGQLVQTGQQELIAPDLATAIQGAQEKELAFPLVKNELDHWVLNITDPVMNMNALMLMSDHFRSNRIQDGYRLGDLYYFYVDKDMVHFHNRTTSTLYALNTTLEAFNAWYEKSLGVIEQRKAEFLGK